MKIDLLNPYRDQADQAKKDEKMESKKKKKFPSGHKIRTFSREKGVPEVKDLEPGRNWIWGKKYQRGF